MLEHLHRRLEGERREGDLAVEGSGHPGRVVFRPEIEDGQAPRPLDRLDVIGEEQLARRVEPVEVLEHGHARLVSALRVAEALHQTQEPPLARLGVHRDGRSLGVGHREEVEHQGQVVGEALVEQQQLARDPLAGRAVGVLLPDLEERAQQLEQRHQRNRPGMRLSGKVVHGDVLRATALGELVAEPALAHAGLADDPDHMPLSGERLLERPAAPRRAPRSARSRARVTRRAGRAPRRLQRAREPAPGRWRP